MGGDTLFSRRSGTVDYRNVNMAVAYRIGMDHFLFGAGYGSFAKLWRNYFQEGDAELIRDLTSGNESTYYGLFAETGLIGLLLYLAMVAFLFKTLVSIWMRLSPAMDFERDFVLTSVALLVIALIHGYFGDLRFSLATNTIVFLFAGISVSIAERSLADAGSASPASRLQVISHAGATRMA
jgi:O-antigen ligase